MDTLTTGLCRRWIVPVAAIATLGAGRVDVPLIEAVKNGDTAAVYELLEGDADVNARQRDGATALHWAAYRHDLETADLLIRSGADANVANDFGVTPLWVAATSSNAAMIERLLEAGGDPNLAPATGGTPLMVVSRQGNVAAVTSLLSHGADANAKEGAQGQTALMWAVAQRHPAVVQILLDAGADLTARTTSSRRYVLLCCQRGLGDSEGAVWIEQGGFTPLLFATRHGAVRSAELLLAAGAPVDDIAAAGTTPLVVAAQHGDHPLAAVLLAAGANPDAAGAGYAALHWAALRGDGPLVELLLAHGADPDMRLMRGSALKRLSREYAFDKRLTGATAFLLAARRADHEIMRHLAEAGADTSLALDDGRTPAMVAAAGENAGLGRLRLQDSQILETVALALDLGGDVNAVSETGDTVLHVAADNEFDDVIRLLAERGAELNTRNEFGQTPLAVALAPPKSPWGTVGEAAARGRALGGAALARYREEYAAWEATNSHTSTTELLRSFGATED